MTQALKTDPIYFKLVVSGEKTFEVRKDDRNYKEGQDLILQEYDQLTKTYTGNEWHGKITMIMRDDAFCKKGFCIMSIKPKENDY